MKCEAHPRLKRIRRPRILCTGCWRAYLSYLDSNAVEREKERKRYVREWQQKNRIKTRNYQRVRRLKSDYANKARIRMQTSRLVKAGRLKKLNCKVCGHTNTEAHHTDYKNPRHVTWLCKQHHGEAHRRVHAT